MIFIQNNKKYKENSYKFVMQKIVLLLCAQTEHRANVQNRQLTQNNKKKIMMFKKKVMRIVLSTLIGIQCVANYHLWHFGWNVRTGFCNFRRLTYNSKVWRNLECFLFFLLFSALASGATSFVHILSGKYHET